MVIDASKIVAEVMCVLLFDGFTNSELLEITEMIQGGGYL